VVVRNVAMLVEYDGTEFHGWQRQARARTAAGTLETALAPLLGHDVRLVGAGRTDRGVHAVGQVANFMTSSSRSLAELLKALNATLPTDVTVRQLREVPKDFHARYDATSRRYRYRVSLRRRSVGRAYCWEVQAPLVFDLMQEAAEALVGRWDFRSFCVRPAEAKSLECTVMEARWVRQPGYLVFDIEADRFLHRMVRCLVGALVDVGLGRIGPPEVASLLQQNRGGRAGSTAPASGLILYSVRYPVPDLFGFEEGGVDEAGP
jgi:tRNA pseudouridine38-40 synthase